LGVVLRDDHVPIDEFMVAVVTKLQLEGIRQGGLVQHRTPVGAKCSFEFEDIATGSRYRLTQNLGPESRSCALDSAAFADATAVVRAAVEDSAQIVVINKFGEQEATGHGLRQEMLQTVLAGIPLLTSVKRRYLSDWMAFAGDEAELLPMSLPAIVAWCIDAVNDARTRGIVRADSGGPRLRVHAI